MPAAAPAAPPRTSLRASLASLLRTWREVLHAVLGVPNYERYVRHLREHHPECPVPSRRDFERERMKARYERPGSRCC
jgi:uncharacterized short protein YbdD (DUF466 family)